MCYYYIKQKNYIENITTVGDITQDLHDTGIPDINLKNFSYDPENPDAVQNDINNTIQYFFETLLSKHDDWTVTTRDKSLSAQFEHTLGVTKDGFEIFTTSPKGLDFPPYKI